MERPDIIDRFNEAVDAVNKFKTNLSPIDELQFYKYYMQAIQGRCNEPQPWLFSILLV
jgi:acyl-CoA-binding protein